jgi:F-type H+-transporting ATPase subunit alpha
VSRVGGSAQTKIMKKLSGSIRVSLAQYRELAAFAQFASDLDEATRKQLERGQRAMELLKQKQYSPLSIALMGLSLFALNEGYLDDVELEKIGDFESGLHQQFEAENADLIAKINESGDWNDEFTEAFKKVVEDFKSHGTW